MADVLAIAFWLFVILPLALYGWFTFYERHVMPWLDRHVKHLFFRLFDWWEARR